MSIHSNQIIPSLLSEYADGLYTPGEVVWKAADLLCDQTMRSFYWTAMPIWLKTDIKMAIESIGEGAELFTFGRGNPATIKSQLLALKAWFHSHPSDT